MQEMNLEQILQKFKQRKVGERMLRVSTPLANFRSDDIPSPMANKKYSSNMNSSTSAFKSGNHANDKE